MTINELMQQSFDIAHEKGWHEDFSIPEKLCLAHEEISEALRDYRNDTMDRYYEGEKPCGFGIELADLFIRIADLALFLDIDLTKDIIEKMEYNKTRDYRHGGKRA